jgi:hypothetical protein
MAQSAGVGARLTRGQRSSGLVQRVGQIVANMSRGPAAGPPVVRIPGGQAVVQQRSLPSQARSLPTQPTQQRSLPVGRAGVVRYDAPVRQSTSGRSKPARASRG